MNLFAHRTGTVFTYALNVPVPVFVPVFVPVRYFMKYGYVSLQYVPVSCIRLVRNFQNNSLVNSLVTKLSNLLFQLTLIPIMAKLGINSFFQAPPNKRTRSSNTAGNMTGQNSKYLTDSADSYSQPRINATISHEPLFHFLILFSFTIPFSLVLS